VELRSMPLSPPRNRNPNLDRTQHFTGKKKAPGDSRRMNGMRVILTNNSSKILWLRVNPWKSCQM